MHEPEVSAAIGRDDDRMFVLTEALQMSYLRSLPPIAALALLLVVSLPRAEEQPQLFPTRDVDIIYDVTRPYQPRIRERVRWLASEHLERVDGPDKSTTIFDRNANEITLLTPASRTYSQLEGAPRRPLEPETGAVLKRGNESVVTGLHCVDWSWTEDVETHTVCATADGVLLRLVVDGKTVMQARSVSYGAQGAELFQVPPDYAPALASPETPRLVR
jgi:hypothetical protein